ncbi:MAG: hypothetical protein LBU64_12860 [Planctomycetota bacterium]|jgi:hypothetical protein|nr:hypothetical protein [Planctomycetota bacterium]
MSLAAIQDSLVKTSLVQQTQTREDGIGRGQEIASVNIQRELSRQEDQVVIGLRQKEEHGIRPDEERQKEGKSGRRGRKRGDDSDSEREEKGEFSGDSDPGLRPVMRSINIVV